MVELPVKRVRFLVGGGLALSSSAKFSKSLTKRRGSDSGDACRDVQMSMDRIQGMTFPFVKKL